MSEPQNSNRTVAEIQVLLDYQHNLVNAANEDYQAAKEIMERALQELRNSRNLASQLEEELREAMRREAIEKAEAAKRAALAPDFDNPDLILMLKLLEGLPHYNRLRDFQKEDLIIFFDRYLKFVKGFINANDMGLGKTAELAFFLQVLEKFKKIKKEQEIHA